AFGHTAVFSPDGKLALYVSGGAQPFGGNLDDAALTLWDAGQGHIVSEWRVPKAALSACAIAADNKPALLAIPHPDPQKGTESIAVRYRDLGNEKDVHTLAGHKTLIAAVAISPDGKQALSGSVDGVVKHWDLERGKEGVKLAGHMQNGSVSSIGFTPDGKT